MNWWLGRGKKLQSQQNGIIICYWNANNTISIPEYPHQWLSTDDFNKQKIFFVWCPMLLISLLLIYLVIFSWVKPYFAYKTIKISLLFSDRTFGGRFFISLPFFISILMKWQSIFIFFALPPVQLHSQRFN